MVLSLSRRHALAGLGAVLAAPAFVKRAQAAEVSLKLHHFLPPMSGVQKLYFEPWAKAVSEKSGGRIEVSIFPSMQLGGKPPQLAEQVKDGVVDIAWTLPAYTQGRYLVAETITLPFMIKGNAEKTSLVQHHLMNEFGADEYKGVKVLGYHVHDGGKFHMRDAPIRTVADLKGKKIRVPSEGLGKVMTAMGASPIFMTTAEIAQSMASGVIDGTCLPYEVVPALKLHELCKSHTQPAAGAAGGRGIYTTSFTLLMNQAKYEGLPDDLRKVIDEATGENVARQMGGAFDTSEVNGIAAVKKRGNEIIDLPEADVQALRDASEPVYAEWTEKLNKANIDGAAVIKRLNELLDAIV